MSKHTPGPWHSVRAKYEKDGEFDFAIGAVIDGRPRVIAETFGRVAEDVRPNAEANARLIAAAPEMLEALKWCVDTMRERIPEVLGAHPEGTLAAQAIAKAESRS